MQNDRVLTYAIFKQVFVRNTLCCLHHPLRAGCMRGGILIEGIVTLAISGVVAAGLITLITNISKTSIRASQAHQGAISATKAYAAIFHALRTHERNRMDFAATISRPPLFILPHGNSHPLTRLSGPTKPNDTSDIVSLIDVANQYRGRVVEISQVAGEIKATVCGLIGIPSSDQFRSYVLYAVDQVYQITGTIYPVRSTCLTLSGNVISGIVSRRQALHSAPIVFAPVEREYSLFVDTTSTFRIASHVGDTILENQPIVGGIKSISIDESRYPRGVSIFRTTVSPLYGRPISLPITPGLSQRALINDVLQ